MHGAWTLPFFHVMVGFGLPMALQDTFKFSSDTTVTLFFGVMTTLGLAKESNFFLLKVIFVMLYVNEKLGALNFIKDMVEHFCAAS